MMKSSSEHVLRLETSSTLHPRAPERKSSVHLPMGAQCAICLSPICERAWLELCAHEFCRPCLLEWSKCSRECPLCRGRFNSMQTQTGRLPILSAVPLITDNSSTGTSGVTPTGASDAAADGDTIDSSSDPDADEDTEEEDSDRDQDEDELLARIVHQFEQNQTLDCDNLSQLLNRVFGHVQFEGPELDLFF